MSIINDALKKTQENFTQQSEQDVSGLYEKMHSKSNIEDNLSSSTLSQEPSQKLNLKNFFIFIFFILSIGVFAASLLLISSKSTSKKSSHPLTQPIAFVKSIITKETSKMPVPEPKRTYKEGELFLNGTMQTQGKTVALINDQIYEVGDSVQGQKITDIRMDGVELLKGEQKIFLSVH